MCLIVVGWRAHPDYPLVVAANRDEFHARPAAPLARWPHAPQVIGGIDLEAGGTWLGVTEHGRFAAVTNVREPGMAKGERTRGELTRNFLLSSEPALVAAKSIDGSRYSGFNLLLGDGKSLVYCSNRDGEPRALPPGIYGLSNHRLDTPWPKLVKACQQFAAALTRMPAEGGYFELLADRQLVRDEDLPDTGVGLEWERRLSAIFVCSEHYGTRASTVVQLHRNGTLHAHERSFDAAGELLQSSEISTAV